MITNYILKCIQEIIIFIVFNLWLHQKALLEFENVFGNHMKPT